MVGRRSAAIPALLLLASLCGCEALQLRQAGPATQTDRLLNAYDDLKSGRFVVIADFENPLHMELFQLVRVSDRANCVRDQRGGRPATGRACLRFTAGGPGDAVVISNAHAAAWYLKRDWRPYDLLLMAVEAPQRGLSLDVEIHAGGGEAPSAVHSVLPLDTGWNIVRLDLAEVGERLPIDDVREVRLTVAGTKDPVTLRVDDLILTSNRRDLLGDSSNTGGALYVQQVGRRWRIGAGGRFELSFANGQIVGWHATAQDPHRLRNLVAGTTLGPSPIVVGSEAEPAGFAALGRAILVHPRILEMSGVRVVVACDWRFLDTPEAPAGAAPFTRWVYTIYPTGQVFVAVESTARTETWSPEQLGLATTMVAEQADAVQVRVAGNMEDPPNFATARSESADYLLLYALAGPSRVQSTQERGDGGDRRVTFVATQSPSQRETEQWVCQLLLADAGSITNDEAAARARAFREPSQPEAATGELVAAGTPYATPEGFDRASGTYVLSPQGGRVSLTLDGRRAPFFAPAFTILDSERLEAWVYVDQFVHEPVARDAAGNIVFQLGETIRDVRTVEVLLRRPRHVGGA